MSHGPRFWTVVWLLLCSFGLRADIIHLKNGNRITAYDVREDGKRVTYQTDNCNAESRA